MVVSIAGRSFVVAAALVASAALGQSPSATTPPASADPLLDSLAPLPGPAVEWPVPPDTTEAGGSGEIAGDVRYTLTVTGLDEIGLADRFRALSTLHGGRGAPANIAQINRRLIEDRTLAETLLRSVGRYGANIEGTIAPGEKADAPTQVTIAIDPGPLYTFERVDLTAPPSAPPGLVAASLGLKAGAPVDATAVSAALDGLRVRLADQGYPFPVVGTPDIVIDHASRTAVLAQAIDPGQRARFGKVRLVGTELFSDQHAALLGRFKPGDDYTGAELEDLRRAFVATGLFGAVSVKPVNAGPNPDGTITVDVVVDAEAAPLRTLAGQIGYSTGQGFRLEASWQHRNLLPPEGAVTFRGVAAEREQLLGAELRRRNFRRRDTTLIARTQIANEDQDAYRARSVLIAGALERETNLIWQKKWYYSFGAELLATNERDRTGQSQSDQTYYIVAAPLSLTYDGSDDLLDPTRGFRLGIRAVPEISFESGTSGYARVQLDGSAYFPATSRITLAGRARVGSIIGASRVSIAPSRRFYAGGGGSVRGYGYQDVGPRDADNDPLGGKSLVEFAAEARIRFTAFGNELGVVPFIDAGQVATGTRPRLDDLRYGAGIGLRYYTAFGPVRVDLATPLNPQRGDPKVAFYVSIGQAF